jgi:hypothetical protein
MISTESSEPTQMYMNRDTLALAFHYPDFLILAFSFDVFSRLVNRIQNKWWC